MCVCVGGGEGVGSVTFKIINKRDGGGGVLIKRGVGVGKYNGMVS